MPKPRYNGIKGNFVEVIDALGLPQDFYGPQKNIGEYYNQAKVDGPRTSYVSFTSDVITLQKELIDSSHLYTLPPYGLIKMSNDPLSMSREELNKISQESYCILYDKKIYEYNPISNTMSDELTKHSNYESVMNNHHNMIAKIFPQEFDTLKPASMDDLISLTDNTTFNINEKGELKDPGRPLAWTQGVSDGRIITVIMGELYLFTKAIEGNTEKEKNDNYDEKMVEKKILQLLDSVGFCFLDDNGKVSGFSVGFLKDENTQQYKLYAVVINDVKASPSDRTVTFFSDTDLIIEKLVSRKSKAINSQIPGNFLFDEIAKSVNSVTINQLINNIFTKDGLISIDNFLELKQRIQTNQNIDNRDIKKEDLNQRLALLTKTFPDNNELKQFINKIKTCSQRDVNFFKQDNFDSVIDKINDINKFLSQGFIRNKFLSQGFIRRNLGMALLWSASVVMLVGVFAVLAGALAPLGIAVASGAGLLGGVLVAAGAAALSLVAVVRMQSNEKNFGDGLAAFNAGPNVIKANEAASEQYEKKSSAYNTKIKKLDTGLKNLMEASSEVPVINEASDALINEVQSNLDKGLDALKNSRDVPIMPNSSQSPSPEEANNAKPSDAQPVVEPSLPRII